MCNSFWLIKKYKRAKSCQGHGHPKTPGRNNASELFFIVRPEVEHYPSNVQLVLLRERLYLLDVMCALVWMFQSGSVYALTNHCSASPEHTDPSPCRDTAIRVCAWPSRWVWSSTSRGVQVRIAHLYRKFKKRNRKGKYCLNHNLQQSIHVIKQS